MSLKKAQKKPKRTTTAVQDLPTDLGGVISREDGSRDRKLDRAQNENGDAVGDFLSALGMPADAAAGGIGLESVAECGHEEGGRVDRVRPDAIILLHGSAEERLGRSAEGLGGGEDRELRAREREPAVAA